MVDSPPALPSSSVLRVTLVWGDTILGAQVYHPGRSVTTDAASGLGGIAELEGQKTVAAACGPAWEIDPRGATEGRLLQRGLERPLARHERPLLREAGDAAVLTFGGVRVCLQILACQEPPPRPWLDPLLTAAAGFALVCVAGGMALACALTGTPVRDIPRALLPPATLSRLYHVTLEASARPPAAPSRGGALPGSLPASAPPRPGGALRQAQVNGVLLAHFEELEACAEGRKAAGAALAVLVVIGANGVVQDVRFEPGAEANPVAQCVGDRLRRFAFPPAAAATTARVQLALAP